MDEFRHNSTVLHLGYRKPKSTPPPSACGKYAVRLRTVEEGLIRLSISLCGENPG
jgi:hypothetical protein